LYAALFRALDLDVPPSIWGVQPRDPEEQLHTELYVHLAKELWQQPDAISLLVAAAKETKRVHDVGLLPAAPTVSLGKARFVYLDGTPSLMAAVPRGMLYVSPNFDFDPLPPPQSENKFSNRTQELPWNPPSDETFMEGLLANFGMASHEAADEVAVMNLVEALEAADEDAPPGIVSQLIDFLERRGYYGPPAGNEDNASAGSGGDGAYMPGAWVSDEEPDETDDETDDEMPKLIPCNEPDNDEARARPSPPDAPT